MALTLSIDCVFVNQTGIQRSFSAVGKPRASYRSQAGLTVVRFIKLHGNGGSDVTSYDVSVKVTYCADNRNHGSRIA